MRASVPVIGPWLPTATVHLVFLGVAVALCLFLLEDPFWLAAGLLAAVGGTFLPNLVARWWVLLVLSLSQFWREPSVTDVAFYLLLAGVHFLHIIGSLAGQMPWNGRMQRRALWRPLRRYVLVQLPVQAVAVGSLLAFSGGRGTVPGLSILSAAVLGILAAFLGRMRQKSSFKHSAG